VHTYKTAGEEVYERLSQPFLHLAGEAPQLLCPWRTPGSYGSHLQGATRRSPKYFLRTSSYDGNSGIGGRPPSG